MHIWRAASLIEAAVAWKKALTNKDGPTSIILSRQNLNNFSIENISDAERGGYFIKHSPDSTINLIAT